MGERLLHPAAKRLPLFSRTGHIYYHRVGRQRDGLPWPIVSPRVHDVGIAGLRYDDFPLQEFQVANIMQAYGSVVATSCGRSLTDA